MADQITELKQRLVGSRKGDCRNCDDPQAERELIEACFGITSHAEVGGAYLLVADQLLPRAGQDDITCFQHIAAVGDG